MRSIQNLLMAILKSLCGIALVLVGVMLAATGVLIYVPIGFAAVGLIICLFSFFDVDIRDKKKTEGTDSEEESTKSEEK